MSSEKEIKYDDGYPFGRDKKGRLVCRCGGDTFTICQPPGEWDTQATCVKCGADESIHSG